MALLVAGWRQSQRSSAPVQHLPANVGVGARPREKGNSGEEANDVFHVVLFESAGDDFLPCSQCFPGLNQLPVNSSPP